MKRTWKIMELTESWCHKLSQYCRFQYSTPGDYSENPYLPGNITVLLNMQYCHFLYSTLDNFQNIPISHSHTAFLNSPPGVYMENSNIDFSLSAFQNLLLDSNFCFQPTSKVQRIHILILLLHHCNESVN